MYISIHAPLAGCDSASHDVFDVATISIHAPLAGCDPPLLPPQLYTKISIHAPLAGCDLCEERKYNDAGISIHAPLAGCDSIRCMTTPRSSTFQSTHPLRGATRSPRPPCARQGHFNPRTPCGVRLHLITDVPAPSAISIHAPLAGCDARRSNAGRTYFISIHAPLAGCDGRRTAAEQLPGHFNPRTPCGVRHGFLPRIRTRLKFQSTHPLRGATRCCR